MEITPQEFARMRASGAPFCLVDVREPVEHATANIAGSKLIPMRSIPQQLAALEEEESPLVLYCHHGIRSLQVVYWMREQGLENCLSLAGGIDRWSLEIDPAVPRY
jgi:rhodanese-related sulfurtransferase